MRELPILFTPENCQAVIDDRKTQTRRPVRGLLPDAHIVSIGIGNPIKIDKDGEEYPGEPIFAIWGEDWHIPAPHQIGDRLYVKEKTLNVEKWGYAGPVYAGSEECADALEWGLRPSPDDVCEVEPYELRYRPSIFMPKAYARIRLEVADIKVERVQDISEDDARAEGMRFDFADGVPWDVNDPDNGPTSRDLFQSTWNGLYGSDPVKGWDANPWVYAYTFRRIDCCTGKTYMRSDNFINGIPVLSLPNARKLLKKAGWTFKKQPYPEHEHMFCPGCGPDAVHILEQPNPELMGGERRHESEM